MAKGNLQNIKSNLNTTGIFSELDIHFAEQDATSRSLAVRALENDSLVHELLSLETLAKVVAIRQKTTANIEADFHIANVRYTHLHELCKQVRRQEGKLSRSFSDKVDQVVLNKFIGIPFFLL